MRFLAVVLLVALPASADVIYSDLGSGGSFNSSEYLYVAGAASGVGFVEQAFQFTAGGTGTENVSQIDIALDGYSGVNAFTAGIYSTPSGSPVGAETFDFTGNVDALDTISGITGLELTAGQQYYLVVGPEDPSSNSLGALWVTDTAAMGDHQVYFGHGWIDLNAASVLPEFDLLSGSASTPEPASLGLFGAGVIALAMSRRFARKS